MHQERSVLGCLLLLHRILFVFGRAMRPGCQVTSVVHQKSPKTLKTRVLSVRPDEKFPNIERNFTFTRKRTGNEERNEIPEECLEVSLSDSNE